METKKCIICGFNRGLNNHHIIKKRDGGSDEPENLVYLCPNHHWIADFGTEQERLFILEEIKKLTGKVGKEISKEDKEKLDIKIKALLEESLCWGLFKQDFKPFTEEEWKKHKETWNYEVTFKMLMGRGCSQIECSLLHKRAELLILIRKLKDELDKIKF